MKKTFTNKKQLAGIISSRSGIKMYIVETVINEVFEQIQIEVKHGNLVRINRFGLFKSVQRQGRSFANKAIVFPAHKAPVFRASQNFKKKIK